MRERIVLSDRLNGVASFVSPGYNICDVGCDHGFVPIYLVQQGISPRALAMDARKGPLRQAKEHVAACGLDGYIETRLSDGLHAYQPGEADTLICAGMGGKLMKRILEEDREKTDSFKELVLQPQSDIPMFRAFLRRQGYQLIEENIIEEDGKFYPMMKAVKREGKDPSAADRGTVGMTGIQNETMTLRESFDAAWISRMEDRYGPLLLRKKHPVLRRYLEREIGIADAVLEQLQAQGLAGSKQRVRYEEVKAQLEDCKRVMAEILAVTWDESGG
ncbi:MAG: class I SAM-dependent methyltransferase [Lachnospiraceae bacterium]|nr:class I SAM-dependent methyltransferase [Lachnospiraceae bacterium]